MKKNDWSILFCTLCCEPTPPANGLITDYNRFICDECLNELEREGAVLKLPATPHAPIINKGY